MRKPNLRNLKLDPAGTVKIRAAMSKKKSVKITINVDADSLTKLRRLSAESGVPYQRLLNIVLRDGLQERNSMESRLARLEKELQQVKKRVAA